MNDTPNSSKLKIELQETDALISHQKHTPLSYTGDGKSASYSSLSLLGIDNHELVIIVLGAAAGNFLEWFNFALFGLMADIFGQLFFPKSNTTMYLIQIYILYAAVFLMRIIGGIIFGIIGDRYGRLQALKLSIILMAVSTLITAILPTYDMIGIWATILMILVRLIQGLSVGGELTGALIYIVEVCQDAHRAKFAILVQITGFGTLLASGFMAIIDSIFTTQEILDYAWRIPFCFGCLIGLFGVWARVYLTQDSPMFLRAQRHGDLVNNPMKHAFKTCKLRMFSIVLHGAFNVFAYYIYFVWLPIYFSVINDYNFNVFAVNVAGMIICACSALISTHWIDTYKRVTTTKIILTFGPIHVVLSVILFYYLNNPHDDFLAITIWLILALSYGLYYGPAAAIWYIDMLPDITCKYVAFGISYNVCTALLGGTAGLIATFVLSQFGNVSSVGWVLFIIGCISISNDGIACLACNYYKKK